MLRRVTVVEVVVGAGRLAHKQLSSHFTSVGRDELEELARPVGRREAAARLAATHRADHATELRS